MRYWFKEVAVWLFLASLIIVAGYMLYRIPMAKSVTIVQNVEAEPSPVLWWETPPPYAQTHVALTTKLVPTPKNTRVPTGQPTSTSTPRIYCSTPSPVNHCDPRTPIPSPTPLPANTGVPPPAPCSTVYAAYDLGTQLPALCVRDEP